MLVLRDGRKLIGVLRSWDQFGMHHSVASSRRSVTNALELYSQPCLTRHHRTDFRARPICRCLKRHIPSQRGERITARRNSAFFDFYHQPQRFTHHSLPQDLDKDDYIPEPYRKASPEEVHALSVKEARDRKRTDKMRQGKLQDLGFEVEHTGEILF